MELQLGGIDAGKAFDWGRTSADYAKYRDIYPPRFYEEIVKRGLCSEGMRVLDVGTGTGVLPRNLYAHGAQWVGTDITPEQIAQAKQLAEAAGQQIAFYAAAAEEIDEPDASFDTITACQCFCYFDPARAYPNFARMLKPGGRLVLLMMNWLPEEDAAALASEQLVLKYNPVWNGAGQTREMLEPPPEALEVLTLTEKTAFDLRVPFTRESWHGRMKACRGTGASLTPEQFAQWDAEHRALLERTLPEKFEILHLAAMTVLTKGG